MYRVNQDEPSQEFKEAWLAAARHIQNQADTGLSWLRSNLNPPMAEHLSFRIGNQLFFIFVVAAEFSESSGPAVFYEVCDEAKAVPCLMPMERKHGSWAPVHSGWGLQLMPSQKTINPLDFVSDELVEMTDWEIHDFAIQIVCTHLEKEGKRVFGKQPSTKIDPSIWYEDDDGAHFVVVRAGRYPSKEVPIPENLEAIKRSCITMSRSGFFATVIFANSNDPFDPMAAQFGNYLPLHRGHGVMVMGPRIIPI